MRVVFDTNILISALPFPGGRGEEALRRVLEGKDQLLLSKPLLKELLRVLAQKFSQDREELSRVAVFLAEVGEMIIPRRHLRVLDDEPDNRVLECAVTGKADVIVTGDQAMLKVGEFKGVQMLSLKAYLESR